MKNLLRLSLALSIAFVICGCGKTVEKPAAKSEAEFAAKLESIRQSGEPVTLAELNTWYAEPSADENAATLYEEAFAALDPANATSPNFLEKNQKSLSLLHRAADRTKCRYPIDLASSPTVTLPHLTKLKTCAQLLQQELLANIKKGRTDLATQSAMAAFRLADSLDQEPILMSRLVLISVEHSNVAALEQAFTQKQFAEVELAQLQSELHELESHGEAGMSRCLAGERCLGIAMLQAAPDPNVRPSTNADPSAQFPASAAYRKSPAFDADRNFYVAAMNSVIAAAKSSFPVSLEMMSHWTAQVSESKSKGYIMSGLLLAALEKALDKSAASIAESRVAQTAIAMERYRLVHDNTPPDALSLLVPQFLASIPTDPFDGKPIRFKKLSSKGYVVYSIGSDQEDNAGTPKPTGADTGVPFDVTFSVKR